jgi:hypothetical protein
MFSNKRFRLLFALLALSGFWAAGRAFAADWKTLPGHVPPGLAKLTPLGTVSATRQLHLAIGLPLRDSAGLDQFLTQLYDPASPSYRQYLSPGEFTARFGPSEQDYEAVKQFAAAHGLTVTGTCSNRLVLDVAGPPAAVENAFHIRLQTYQHPTEARQFFAPDSDPTVPSALPVADIQGLSDFSQPHPRLKRANLTRSPKDGSGSDGAYLGDDFRNAYLPGTTLTGSGQSVGLFEFDGYYASDIAAYAAAAGGGRSGIVIQPVLLDGFNGVPTSGANSGDGEVSLDIEMAMAMAPGLAKIVVFEAGPAGLQNDVLNAMSANSAVKNLACCWGWSGGPSTTTDTIFKQLAAQGQSFFNASGDTGAFTLGASSDNGVDNPSTENAPSSSPYITQVGGTTLTMNGMGASYSSETVWNWGGGTSSGGGVSSYYPLPAWQSGVGMTANGGSTAQRNIPDVALTADNVVAYDSDGSVDYDGGTSCAAPLWAGFMALVNQQAVSLGNPPAGFINPAIYAIGKGQNAAYPYAACFHDTTTGNNFWSESPDRYSAVAGYDLCTGWGTPNGANLIGALAGAPGAGLMVVVQKSMAFSGFAGGPFNPATATFQLTNASNAALGWSLVSTSAWLNVASTNGSLAGFATASLGVSLTAAAGSLRAGTYSTSLTFTSLAKHLVQTIPVTLQVNQPLALSSGLEFAASGPVGGPFAAASQTFVLANGSGSPVAWKLIGLPFWLTASPAGGSVAAGGLSNVTVSVLPLAKSFRAAVYGAMVSFTNASGPIATMQFTLSVGQPLLQNGGFEDGNFTGWTQSGNSAYSLVASHDSSFVHSGIYGAALGPADSPGYLSQTVPTVSGQAYLLSLWLRNATGDTPNWFQVQWNGAAVFVQSNLATTAWTNVQLILAAAGSSSLLQLGYQDDPNYLGLDDVSLKAVAGTSVKSAVRRAGDFQLVWNTRPGSLYQAQFKTNLSQPDWINLGGLTAAGAETLLLTDTNSFHCSPQRFYRLLEVPQ